MRFLGFDINVSKTSNQVGTQKLGNKDVFTFMQNMANKVPESLTEDNGFEIASTVGEVFIPIDIIAEKVGKLFEDLILVNDSGKEIPMPKNIQRLIDKPNIYTNGFGSIAYDSCFNELSDGNNYLYFKAISEAKRITPDNVQQIYNFEPNQVEIKLKGDQRDYLKAVELSDYIEYYEYTKTNDKINPMFIMHSKVSNKTRQNFSFKAQSPLWSVNNNINNLLASYSARYNSFVANGSAGYICPEVGSQTTMDVVQQINKRDAILEDLNTRNGITGNRHFYGISGIPLKYVNTLGTIKDLMPYDESLANFLIIAGIYGVDKDLLPLKEGTTFTNKEVAEAKVWNDIAITYADDLCRDLTNMFNLTVGHFAVKKDNVGFLESKRKTEAEADKIELENIKLLQELIAQNGNSENIKLLEIAKQKYISKYGNKEQ